jgi:hypothetical protein
VSVNPKCETLQEKKRKEKRPIDISLFITSSGFSGPFAVAAHDLHFFRADRRLVIQFECDILNQESPDFVAESVRIEVALDTEVDYQHFPVHERLEGSRDVQGILGHAGYNIL